MAINKSEHLNCVLKSHKMSHVDELKEKHITKRHEIAEVMAAEYGSKMYSVINSGSYAKHTAINVKFDFDLVAPFKRDSFDTLEKMYNEVYDLLLDKFGSQATLRKQKVSIGLTFTPDDDGDIVNIDVVPGRELNQDQYKDDNKLNLYVNETYGKIAKSSDRIVTNIKAQIDNIKGKDSERQNIRLMKVWKYHNEKKPKSFFMELIVIKAFEKESISGDLWEKLKKVLEYIRDNVKTVVLTDPGNSSNDIADTLNDNDKQELSDDMKNILERIESNSENIKLYFPINNDFPCENGNNAYSVKKTEASIPPTTQFGNK